MRRKSILGIGPSLGKALEAGDGMLYTPCRPVWLEGGYIERVTGNKPENVGGSQVA